MAKPMPAVEPVTYKRALSGQIDEMCCRPMLVPHLDAARI